MHASEGWIKAPGLAFHRGRQASGADEHARLIGDLQEGMPTERRIRQLRDAMFAGEKVNTSENRAAGHWALRSAVSPSEAMTRALQFAPEGINLIPRMSGMHAHARDIAERIRSGAMKGASSAPYRHVIHLGIGGSDVGPRMLIEALRNTPQDSGIDVAFLSNLDYHAVQHCLSSRQAAETLVVVASKSFATQETMNNLRHLLQWMVGAGIAHPEQQVIAITSRPDMASQWRIPGDQILWFDDSIGGRFSLWGPVSLTSRIILGNDPVDTFIRGGLAMDHHFIETQPLSGNLPAVLAATDLYNLRQRRLPTLMVSAYDSRLSLLVPYLKQLWMESLGKQVDSHGQRLDSPACPILWGDIGTNAQHAFFQLLHQGVQGIAIELIGVLAPEHEALESHHMLLANLVAQAQALSTGQLSDDPQRSCRGGHPVNLVFLDRCDPYSLGSLIALWEHRVVCLAALTGVNPFDQWGVEFGKSIASAALASLRDAEGMQAKDLDDISKNIIGWLRERSS